MLLKIEDQWEISNAREFVLTFGLQEEFRELMDVGVSEWEVGTGMADEGVIRKLLEGLDGRYFVKYRSENTGWFEIWKLEDPERG